MNVQEVSSYRRHRIRWVSPLIPLVLACSSVTSPDEKRVLGSIAEYANDDPQIEIVAEAGSVVVQVTTYGDGCYRQGETDVAVQGMKAEITPYDYVHVEEGGVCHAILIGFTHEAEIEFDSSGQAQIVVRGTNADGDTLRVEHTVVVE